MWADCYRKKMNPDISSSPAPPRIMIWGLPRSLSTVLIKCLSFIPDSQIINEPYNCAATFGPEGFSQTCDLNGVDEFGEFMDEVREEIERNPEMYEHGWDDDKCTFQWVKQTLERDYPGKKIIICKDFIFNIMQRQDSLPRGYKHVFLIRNPTKLFLSNRNLSISSLPSKVVDTFELDKIPSWPMYPKHGYGELLDFIAYLKDRSLVQSDPIIIDADDLQSYPASIIRQLCQAVGIPYNDSLITWEAGDNCVSRNWFISKSYLAANSMIGYYHDAFSSTHFYPATDVNAETVTDDVKRLARETEIYYQALHKIRIKP